MAKQNTIKFCPTNIFIPFTKNDLACLSNLFLTHSWKYKTTIAVLRISLYQTLADKYPLNTRQMLP